MVFFTLYTESAYHSSKNVLFNISKSTFLLYSIMDKQLGCTFLHTIASFICLKVHNRLIDLKNLLFQFTRFLCTLVVFWSILLNSHSHNSIQIKIHIPSSKRSWTRINQFYLLKISDSSGKIISLNLIEYERFLQCSYMVALEYLHKKDLPLI